MSNPRTTGADVAQNPSAISTAESRQNDRNTKCQSPVSTNAVTCHRCAEAPRDNVRTVILSECGHPLCSECMRRDTMDTISSGRRTSRLSCPCGSLVSIADLAAAFDDNEMRAFRRLFVE